MKCFQILNAAGTAGASRKNKLRIIILCRKRSHGCHMHDSSHSSCIKFCVRVWPGLCRQGINLVILPNVLKCSASVHFWGHGPEGSSQSARQLLDIFIFMATKAEEGIKNWGGKKEDVHDISNPKYRTQTRLNASTHPLPTRHVLLIYTSEVRET